MRFKKLRGFFFFGSWFEATPPLGKGGVVAEAGCPGHAAPPVREQREKSAGAQLVLSSP